MDWAAWSWRLPGCGRARDRRSWGTAKIRRLKDQAADFVCGEGAGYQRPWGWESDCVRGSIPLREMANTAASFTLVIVECWYASTARTAGPSMSLAIELATCVVLPAVNVLPLLRCQSAPVCAAVCYDGVVNVLLPIQVPGSLTGTELPASQSLSDSPLLVITTPVDRALCRDGWLAVVGAEALLRTAGGGLHVLGLS